MGLLRGPGVWVAFLAWASDSLEKLSRPSTMTLSMETQFELEANVGRVAESLVAAWDSGDRGLLQAAVGQATHELGAHAPTCSLQVELHELLLGVTDALGPLLAGGGTLDLNRGSQASACYQLLRHARGAAAAACIESRG